jgi:hypothetical protein
MADLVGHTLGNYHIDERLGTGGMGEVYRATHIRLHRQAAIKVLHPNQAADPTFQARFLREARAAAALRHPNIVEVFDFGEQEGLSYLVMELIPDGSLRTLLRQRAMGQGWTLGLGVDLVRQAAEGLNYAHTHGMIHRDIKPDNLLLERLSAPADENSGVASGRYLLKISDFGLARLVDEGGELTVTGMVMGTPTYMSPEQCQGGDLDGRSDLYSLGVVLYEVATGAPPFRVKSLSEAVFKHISTPPPQPSSLQPDLPPALEEVILRCLAKRPEDRFATGHDLAEALQGALGDSELRTIITARRPDAPATPTPVVRATPAASPPATAATAATAPAAAVAADLQAPAAKAPVRVATATPPPAIPPSAAENDATVQASLTPAPAPRVGASAWPRASDAEATVATGPGGGGAKPVNALLAQPRMLAGIGGGAVVVVALIILLIATRAGQTTAQNKTAAHPTATTIPTPSATPVETLTYQNALDSSSSRWPRSSHAFFANNGYEISGAWISYAPVRAIGDGTISVRMSQIGGPSDQFYGILFRGASANQYYFYGVAQNQQWTFSIIQNGNGVPIVAPTMDAHINAGLNASNTITVRTRGSQFVFYVNGVQVGQATDSRITSGQTGLINTTGALQVVYNDFTVTTPAP